MSKSTNQKLKLNYLIRIFWEYTDEQHKLTMAELKILVDLVQSAKFLTASKSRQLIKKLETLCSHYEAGQLQHQVYVSERIKTESESIYYTVDILHQAIETGVQITFQYFNWNVKKEKELRRGGTLCEKLYPAA